MSEDDLKEWPPYKNAFQTLEPRLVYGAAFQWEEVLGLLGMKDRDNWEFRSQWFKLVERIEDCGFFVTERGMHSKGFRLLYRREMADHVRQKESRKASDSLRKSLCISKVPRDSLPVEEVKKLDHWEMKAAVLGATAKVLLKKRNLPSPEMAMKSIREVLEGSREETNDGKGDNHEA